MFIIISSDTTARSRCTSHRDGPRLAPSSGGHSRTRTGPPTRRNACENTRESTRTSVRVRVRERKKAIGSTSAFFFFFLPGRISPLHSLPLTPLFSNRAPGSSICVPRTPPRIRHARSPPRRSLRVPGEVSPIRSRQGCPFRPVLLLPTISVILPLYRYIAAASRDNQQARPR